MFKLSVLLGALLLSILTPASPAEPVRETGIASWYGGHWHGKKTANGERYDQWSLTAAHRTLPFGTKVEVTRLSNQKSVVVRINNRGPFTKGRVIDLSRAAAQKLGIDKSGVAKVQLRVL